MTAVFSFIFDSRIKSLEGDKKTLLGELATMKIQLEHLNKQLQDVASTIPLRSERKHFQGETEKESSREEKDNTGISWKNRDKTNTEPHGSMVKRSAAASRTTKGMLYPAESGMNAINNSTTYGSTLNEWSMNSVESSLSPKGNPQRFPKQIRLLFRKQLRNLKKSHRLEIKNLKQKLKQTRQILNANLLCCNASRISADSAYGAQSKYAGNAFISKNILPIVI